MAIAVVATAKVKEGQEAGFEETALKLVEAVNVNEPGCMLYTLNKGDAPLTYVFMERYEDQDAVAAHQTSDHFKTLGRQMGAFMDGRPDVLVLNELG